MKLTKWYPGHIKPVRVGVYQKHIDFNVPYFYSYWDGEFWGLISGTPSGAKKWRDLASRAQNYFWRGVAK